MVRHHFQCLNFDPKLLRFLPNEFLQACFDIPKKNISAIFRTPYKVKMQVENRSRCPSITRLCHDSIIRQCSLFVNYLTKKEEGKRENQASRGTGALRTMPPSTFGAEGARFLCQLKQTVPSPLNYGNDPGSPSSPSPPGKSRLAGASRRQRGVISGRERRRTGADRRAQRSAGGCTGRLRRTHGPSGGCPLRPAAPVRAERSLTDGPSARGPCDRVPALQTRAAASRYHGTVDRAGAERSEPAGAPSRGASARAPAERPPGRCRAPDDSGARRRPWPAVASAVRTGLPQPRIYLRLARYAPSAARSLSAIRPA